MKQTARDYLTAVYTSWFNDYLSAEAFAEHHGITTEQAYALIELARDVATSDHPDA